MEMTEDDSGDLECRVCRTSNESGRLYAPCKCDGSIRYVHQECLETWLRHKNSGTEVCELCDYKYTFKPRYADDAPTSLGGLSLVAVLIKRVFTVGIPWLSRMVCVFWSWLIIVPLVTSWIFRLVVQSPVVSDSWSFQSINVWLLHEIFSAIVPNSADNAANSDQIKEYLTSELITGIVVTLVILTSAVILMSFLDFMRFQRVLGVDGDDIVFMEPPEAARGGGRGGRDPNQMNGNLENQVDPARRAARRWHFAGPGERGQLDPMGDFADPTAGEMADDSGLVDTPSQIAVADAIADDMMEEEGPVLTDEELQRMRQMGQAWLSACPARPADQPGHFRSVLSDDEDDDNPDATDRRLNTDGGQGDGEEEELLQNKQVGDWSPWQFPEDWDYTHGSDRSLTAFKNADDFYSWFNKNEDDRNGVESKDGDAEDHDSDDSDGDDDEGDMDFLAEQMGFDAEDLDPLDFDEAPPGEVDIRAVLLDVLGIRGPLNIMVKNLVFLLIFNGIFLGVFASIPCSLGSFMITQGKILLAGIYDPGAPLLLQIVSRYLSAAQLWLERITSLSTSLRGRSTDPYALGNMIVGYFALLVLVFAANKMRTLHKLVSAHGPGRASKTLQMFDNAIGIISGVVKVGFLLFLRVFFTPTLLGTTILASYNLLARYDEEIWIGFFCRNFVGALMLTWALGICNMLLVTLTVLQLREVLHPDILAKIIRPQEPHLDLLSSLTHESGLVHVRRLFISLLVYLSFIVLFLYAPAKLLSEEVSGIPSSVWQVRVWYGVPQMQIVLETSIVLAVFLSLLERHKNVIGKMLFAWFHRATALLGLTRYFMPLPYEVVALLPTHPHYQRYPDHKMHVVSRSPMVRPPSKWDSKLFERSGRWAWGDEVPCPLECRVAPRLAVPSFCVLRIWLLVAITWALLVLIILACIPTPLIYGRFVLRSLGVPQWLRHDVIAMAAGLCEVVSYFTRVWKESDGWLRKVCDPCTGASFVLVKLRSLAISAFIAGCIGFPYRLSLAQTADTSSLNSFTSVLAPSVILDSFVVGKFFLECILFFAKSGMRATVSEWLGGTSQFFGSVLAQPLTVLRRKLLAAVLVEIFTPIALSACGLWLLDCWQHGQLVEDSLPAPEMSAMVAVVPLFLQISSTVLLISVARTVGQPTVDITAKLVQLFHDSAYSERYLIGRELNDRVPEMPTTE